MSFQIVRCQKQEKAHGIGCIRALTSTSPHGTLEKMKFKGNIEISEKSMHKLE